jgi:hypothetical protein
MKIHTVTAGYIRRFAADDIVTVHDAQGRVRSTGPAAVGFQTDFWGSERVATAVESRLGKTEDRVLRVLRGLPGNWPLSMQDRAEVAQFLAIHVIRLPAFGAFVRLRGEEAIRDVIAAEASRGRATPQELNAAAALLRSQEHHVNTLMRQITRIGSMFSCMQWSLVEFAEDYLITGDQPVVLLPIEPTIVSPATSLPTGGLMNIVEARFPLDPRRTLLMTWQDSPDIERPLSGNREQACSVNAAVRAQMLEEWLHRPGMTPPFYPGLLLRPNIYAISTELLGGYGVAAAMRSRRRHDADALMRRMTEEQPPANEMRWIAAGPMAAAA